MPITPFPDTASQQAPQKFVVRQFAGVNNNVQRGALADNEFFWLENFLPLASGQLRALYAEGPAVYTAPANRTIINAYFFNIGQSTFGIVFLDNGTAQQFDTNTGAVTVVSGVAGTFFVAGHSTPVAVQWNASGIVILANNTANDFWAWDGTTLTTQPAAAPTWLTNGAVTTMPSGVHGNAIEVFQNRLWLTTPYSAIVPTAAVSTLTVSAPANGADFLGSDGSVVTPQQDSSLRYQFFALKQSNGFLYAFGDSNVSAIYNVQTGGSPVVTTYFNQNVSPDIGTPFGAGIVQPLNQLLMFANGQGVYAMSGGFPVKVSYQLDRIFAAGNFGTFTFGITGAVGMIFGAKCYMFPVNAPDQNGNTRNFLCAWDTKEWFVVSGIANISQVYTQEISGLLTTWGSDGTTLFRMFQTPNSALPKRIITKLWSGGQNDDEWMIYKKAYRFYFTAFDYSGNGVQTSGTIDSDASMVTTFSANIDPAVLIWINGTGGVITFRNATPAALSFVVTPGAVIGGTDVSQYGLMLGVSQNFVGSDFALGAIALEYANDATFLG